MGGHCRADLVHPVVRVDDERSAQPAQRQSFRDDWANRPRTDADELRARVRGVRKRPQDVEHRPHGDFPPRAAHVPHGRMEPLREQEPKPAAINDFRHLFAAQVDACAERFQHICAAALR